MDVKSFCELEKVAAPSLDALKKTLSIIEYLFTEYDMLPDRFTPTVEEGTFLRYNVDGNGLIIEIYNDGETGIMVTRDGEILLNEDVGGEDIDGLEKT